MRPLASALILMVVAFGASARAQQPASAGAPLPDFQAPPPGVGAPLPPGPNAPPPMYPQAELERIVSPIALYPDPLLAQVLAGSTYPQDIPAAATWADQHHYLTGPALADAIQRDQLPWDPSVQALLPFPSVLDMMARAMPWTQELGAAFLAQEQDVMNAVQAQRQRAAEFGYLQSNAQVVVTRGPYIEVRPVNPAYVVVPYYDPRVVFVAPRPGFRVVTAVRFGYGVSLGVAFEPWGWGYTRFDWGTHVVIVNREPWRRTWVNRATYVHPYAIRRPAPVAVERREEVHRAIERSERERAAEHDGRKREEDHKREQDRKRDEDKKKERGRGGA
ncbi:MAG TPA: DUF3300 domain-containing protein [Vicinamibacterales bacterium]|nr:DUF3300 domain-containing protein [Vicinamibacterales bacterium]